MTRDGKDSVFRRKKGKDRRGLRQGSLPVVCDHRAQHRPLEIKMKTAGTKQEVDRYKVENAGRKTIYRKYVQNKKECF